MKVLFLNACDSREGDINHALLVLEHLPPDIALSAASLPRGAVYEALRAMPHIATVLPVEMGGSEQPAPNRRFGMVGEAWKFARALWRILGWARRERADIICAIDRTVSAYLAAMVATILRRRFLLIAAYPFYSRGRVLNRWVLRRATRIVAHSEYLAGYLRPSLAVPSRIVVIPDPLATARYRPGPAACAAQRADWNLPADATVILLAGRINEYKGHDDLVRAAQLIAARYPQAYFFFCGREDKNPITRNGVTDTYAAYVRRLIKELNLESRVRFLGYVPDLIVAMGAADIVTMPSHEEPYGLVALEGMALGKPVVATGAGGVPSFIRDKDTGLLVPPRDPEALANALSRLLDDPDAARAMGNRARACVETEFDVAQYMTRFVPVLYEACGARADGADGIGSIDSAGDASHAASRQETVNPG